MRTPLVRERSRVQSSLAAPAFPKEIQHFAKNPRDVSGRFATERNAKTRAKLGENWVARSTSGPPDPGNEIAAQGVQAQRGDKIQVKAANFRDADYVGDGPCAIAKSACPHAGTKCFPPVTLFDPRLLPSRATLARKWPALKINRLTGRWRDDASGASGADVASLLAFIAGRAAR